MDLMGMGIFMIGLGIFWWGFGHLIKSVAIREEIQAKIMEDKP